MENEKEILDYVRAGKLTLPPLSFNLLADSIKLNGMQPDFVFEADWKGQQYKFVAEVKRYSSDKTILDAANQALYYAKALDANPLIIVPWLSTEQLLLLESRGVSGVDLCGNGVIAVPGRILVFRTGQPNKYPTSRLIRRVYSGTSSLVARVFLLRPQYGSVSEVLEEITTRGGNITLPTVSKSLKQLEEDLVIEKSKGKIALLQPEKLLDRLRMNYEQPKPLGFIRCKLTPSMKGTISSVLRRAAAKAKERLVLTGDSSVNFYATMAKEPLESFYCTEFINLSVEKFGAQMDIFSKFPNVELRKTDQETVFFDLRDQDGYKVASPIQTYLELATSDKRGQETAEQIRKKILNSLSSPNRRTPKSK